MKDKWDNRFMDVAKLVSTWSTCIRPNRQVGAVIVVDKRIVATGYNGAPAGVKNCMERGECIREKMGIPSGTRREVCYASCAEQNAIVQTARQNISTLGGTMYVTHKPCSLCAKLIINAGITRVVYLDDYPDELSDELFKASGVKIVKLQ